MAIVIIIFLFFGKVDGGYNDDGQVIKTFHVQKWDIVYPIKRDFAVPSMLLSSAYITPCDCIKPLLFIVIGLIVIVVVIKRYRKHKAEQMQK